MHENCNAIFVHHVLPLLKNGMTTLELSPDIDTILAKAVEESGINTIHYYAGLEHCYHLRMTSENSIEVQNNFFDAIWSSSVIEHVKEPWLWMKELARITKPGGFVAVIGPFTWRQHRVRSGNVKRDAWRILPDGLKILFEQAGLVTEKAELLSLAIGNKQEWRKNRGQPIDVLGIGRKPL